MAGTTARPTTEERLRALLQVDRVEVPDGFVREGTLTEVPEVEDPIAYWAGEAGRLDWFVKPTETLDDSRAPFHRWFADGRLNASHECLDRHVAAGLGERVAFHWHGEDGTTRDITYSWLLDRVQRLANVLLARGVRTGDVVGIHLPMIPEVVVAMLACARIGAPHNVVFGGFSCESVAERLEASSAVALITADGARRKGASTPVKAPLDAHLARLDRLHTVVVVRHAGASCPMHPGRDVDYVPAVEAAPPDCPAERLEAEHPLFVLYSSGSTAKPKGILHTTGGYLVGVTSTQRLVFDVDADHDVWFCTADVGWITGHSYMVYGPLANGLTSVMHEGAPDFPHRGIWWELVQRRAVTHFYTAPTAIRACMKWGEEHVEPFDLSSLRLLGTVGEPINPKAWHWYREVIGGGTCPVVDTWWQTETGAIMVTTLPGAQAMKPGSAGTPLPGVRAGLRDGDVLVLEQPWPSMLRGLFGDDERYVETYWSRYGAGSYLVGDAAQIDEDGYVWIRGRIDDVINVSGHRLSTAEVESALVSHEAVAEAAVVAASDDLTGQAILAFVTLGAESTADTDELREHVAARIGKLARPKRIVFAEDLPKTRSGKIMRRLLRDIAEGRELGDTSTLRDPSIVEELASRLRQE